MISESAAFHTAIFDALCACLNLNRHSAEAAALIHEAYPETEPPPRPPRNRNVIYWTVLQDPSSDPVSTETREERGGGGFHMPVVYTTLKYLLVLVCYGPACEAYARRIRSMLFIDGAGFPRRILREAGIFPVPDMPRVSLLHEEEGSLWRARADLTVSLRVREETSGSSRGSVALAPIINIRR